MKKWIVLCALCCGLWAGDGYADSSTSLAPDISQRTVNWLLHNEIATRTWDSLATFHNILRDSTNASGRGYIVRGTNVASGKATLTAGGSVAKLIWPASYKGVEIDVRWDGANEFLMRVWNHPFADSSKIDSITIAPYWDRPFFFFDADSVEFGVPGSGTGTAYVGASVR